MLAIERRYDIDWIRVIAIGLLLIYHIAIGFQSWGIMIGFITNEQSWETLWIPMSLLNVWRIPLLFFVSGMGVYFAIQKRNWKQLMLERASRIFIPLLFGIFFIVPVHIYLLQDYYMQALSYTFNMGHLWFLGNICAYIVILSPIFIYLKNNEEGRLVRGIKGMLSSPLGLIPFILAYMAEAWIIAPGLYTMYAMTWHGFVLGLLAFFFGYCFVLSGPLFWNMILKWRGLFLLAGALLFVLRFIMFQLNATGYLLALESICWIITVFAFGYRYLNKPGRVLTYLSQAAYPVYIVHMMFLYLGSYLIFPLSLPVPLKFVIVLAFTFIGCFLCYDLIRRVNWLRPVFGLKRSNKGFVGPSDIRNILPSQAVKAG
ncbi:acyltransferase family protein [Cesiribacter sp. SM1]|uniref:acyltransferase family protein n=1 Tax=Cesiribacter sp. SM1 TaxID=2861196 RepID=UPI001CD4A026|nr:acyltransferase family protein [Cesiribacter sp. SM1]